MGNQATQKPQIKPTNSVNITPKLSFRMPFFTKSQSRMAVPNVMAMMGPMRGETSMEATTVAGELVAKPTAEIMAAIMQKQM
jgi:hypothetical protein